MGMTVKTANEIDSALRRQRAEDSSGQHVAAQVAAQAGAVAFALVENAQPANLRRACVDLAALAIRLAEDGDPDFGRGAGGKLARVPR